MQHPCKLCLIHTPTRYHNCEHACYDYRLFISSVTGENIKHVSRESADTIRQNQQELDPDDLG